MTIPDFVIHLRIIDICIISSLFVLWTATLTVISVAVFWWCRQRSCPQREITGSCFMYVCSILTSFPTSESFHLCSHHYVKISASSILPQTFSSLSLTGYNIWRLSSQNLKLCFFLLIRSHPFVYVHWPLMSLFCDIQIFFSMFSRDICLLLADL